MATPGDRDLLRTLGQMQEWDIVADADSGVSGVETYLVSNDNLDQFISVAMGSFGDTGDAILPVTFRNFPQVYCWNAKSSFYNDRIDGENNESFCDNYKVTLQYRPRNLQVTSSGSTGNEVVFEESIEPSVRTVTVSSLEVFLDTLARNPIPWQLQMPGTFLFTETYSCNVQGAGNLDIPVLDYIGAVNSNVINRPSIQRSYPAGTLLMEPFAVNHTVQPSDPSRESFSVRYKLSYNPIGWNLVLPPGQFGRPNIGVIPYGVPIYNSAGVQIITYPSVDFERILPAPPE